MEVPPLPHRHSRAPLTVIPAQAGIRYTEEASCTMPDSVLPSAFTRTWLQTRTASTVQTPRKPGNCYNVTVQMVDGTQIPVAKLSLK